MTLITVRNTEHNDSPRLMRAIHMVKDHPGASEATSNPQSKKVHKKRMYTNPTEVNVGDWVHFKKKRDKYWKSPARVVQKENKSLQCVIRQKSITIHNDGILISKPDTCPVIEEETPILITTNQQLPVTKDLPQPMQQAKVPPLDGTSDATPSMKAGC